MFKRQQLPQSLLRDEIAETKRQRKQAKTLPYQQNESILEEEEVSSISQIKSHNKPQYLLTQPQQPIDYQSSEIKAPTINSNSSSNRVQRKQSESKPQQILSSDESSLLSSSAISRQLMNKNNKKQLHLNHDKVKLFINEIKKKFLNSIHYSKYNDSLITLEQPEVSPKKYYYFNLYIFMSTTISTFLTTIFLPLNQVFDTDNSLQILSTISFVLKLLSLLQDLYFSRGPYKMEKGQILCNFRNSRKVYQDFTTILLIIIVYSIEIEYSGVVILTIIILIGLNYIRQIEQFDNFYRSTQLLIQIILIWISLVICFSCILKLFNDQDDVSLVFCITFSISLLTHNSNINIELDQTNSIIISFYFIISYCCIVYTTIAIFIWIKPDLELQQEKQKLLQGFVQEFSEKCQNEDLLRRCYSYLEFRIDEDLNKTKDQLTKRLSPELQDEIDLSLRSIMVDNMDLMKRFSPHFKSQILYAIEQVTFNPEDNIILENKQEELGLYYILKGEVKVQFQGSSLGNNKRSITKLKEGETFGQYSFISGMPETISIFSSGVTTLMKIKRSEFLDIISNYPEDNEIFCLMKDNALYNNKLFECYYCKIKGEYILECQHIQYFPQRLHVLEKYLFSQNQIRSQIIRNGKKYRALKNLSFNSDKAIQLMNKQSQELVSDEMQEPSQLPYSENQTYSVSYVSNSVPFQKFIQDQQISNSNINLESLDQQQQLLQQQQQIEEELDDQQYANESLRKKSRQNSNMVMHNRTAGFLLNTDSQNNFGNQVNSVLDRDDKEILMQLQDMQESTPNQKNMLTIANRTASNKLTFQFNKQSPQQPFLKQDQIRQESIQQQQRSNSNIKATSQRQASNRSHTYTNSLSKDISNYHSSNSKNNKSLRQSQSKAIELTQKNKSSDQSQSDPNKKNQKSQQTTTKQSTPFQMSQFQALTGAENTNYIGSDLMLNKFEKIKSYTIYFPHNNFEKVIARFISHKQKYSSQKKKKHFTTPYTLKCYVATKIKKILRLLKE